ncbi:MULTISPECIES: hypothetical protein [unclassified Pseudovibrio]|uniref:hypothetical protein n=1 Tax=unclassified Pseudovibrio TaxID=2627060 RepID=UPI00070EF632|nr:MULTISPECIES: hypothetical protein [unclassified Pseudovibrio]
MLRLSGLLVIAGINAAAACPQQLPESGLRLTRTADGYSAVYKKTSAGLVEERVMTRDGKQEKVTTIYLHPLVTGQRISSKGTLSLEYSKSLSNVDSVKQSGQWFSDFVLKYNANEVDRGVARLSYLDEGQVEIGKCSYDVWRIESRLELEGRAAPTTFDRYYSPKLGLVLRAIKLTPDRETINGVVFDQIEVVEPN